MKMNKLLVILSIVSCVAEGVAQSSVGIGTTMPSGSSILDLTSTTKGFLVPRMTGAQRAAIASPPTGLQVYQTNTVLIPPSSPGLYIHDGSSWKRMARAEELFSTQSWTVVGANQFSNVDGNVGIGVINSITEKLTLKGDMLIHNESSSDPAEIVFMTQNNALANGVLRFLDTDSTTTGALVQYRGTYNVLSMSNEIADDGVIHIYDNGNVGIGGNFISDATSKLTIQGGNPQADYDDHGFMQVGPSFSENLLFGNDEILARYNGGEWPLILQEEGGAVKIGGGTVGADTRLHIFGGGESGLTTHGYMVLGSISSSNMVFDVNEIQARINGAASTLRLQQDGGSLLVQGSALVVGSTGNVGIGDLTPDVPLDVEGDAIFNGTNPTVALHNSNVQKGFIQLSGDDFRVGTFSDNDLGSFIVRTNGGDHLFVNPSGNLGVGTASPLQRLHVSGSTYVSGNLGLGISAPTSKLDVAGRINIDHNGEALKIDGNNSFIQMYQNGVAKSYIQQLGNDLRIGSSSGNAAGRIYLYAGEVAINTGADGPPEGYSLSVGGEIICEELRVELQGNGVWPDYVFAQDYNLRPLDELKSFISTNKHLPNIPAAAQVEREGFDVGDMNRRLLEKVEELTLYIMQQQEEIDEMKKAIERLK